MFSDTHFHFKTMISNPEVDGSKILEEMALRDCFLGLDIGTRSDDLIIRQQVLDDAIAKIENEELRQKAANFIYFSAGIWPDVDEIYNWEECIKKLEAEIEKANNISYNYIKHNKIIALGEGGIDHHWNPSGVDGRCESDFDKKTYDGEKALFQAQLELARKLNLPFIVHSRDGFEDTLDCIKNVGNDNGIIHCYSYGLEEVRAFVERGWYISFSGSVTYTKKSKLDEMKVLLNYVPEDRILCETDSPYLAPVPNRGKPNNPVYVEHTFKFIADMRNISAEKLSEIVDINARKLFNL